MKNNNNLIFNILLAIAVLVLYVLHFTKGSQNNTNISTENNKTTKSKAEVKSKTSTRETKVAYVNIDTLEAKYEFFITLKKDLETKQRLIQTDLRNRQSAFQNEVMSFQNSAATMNMQQIENTKKALGQKEQELMNYGQNVENEYVKQERKLNEKLNDNISVFLKKYADENGYTLIFGYSKSNKAIGLIQADDNLEITQEVLKGLNEEYKAGQKEAK